MREFLSSLIEKPISGEWGNEGEGINVLRTTNFTNDGTIDFSNVVKRQVDQKKIDQKKLLIGDIIIEKSGGSPTQPVGRVVFFEKNGDYVCNNFTSVLRPKKGKVFPKFVFYQLFTNHLLGNTLKFQNKTTGIINLKLSNYVNETQIPLPPLEEQKRISAILDAADLHRQKTKALLDKYDELAQALFLDMFGDPVTNPKGWEKIEIQNITSVSSGSTPSRELPENYMGDIPWVKTGEVNGKEIIDTEEKISQTALENSSCKVYPKGSILIAMYGQGKTRGQVGYLGIPASTNQACAVLKYSDKVNFVFLYNLLKLCYEDLRSLGRGGNQPNLNSGLIKKYLVINPPIEIQEAFSKKIKIIESQISQAEQSLRKAEELFQSFLQKAFKGEL